MKEYTLKNIDQWFLSCLPQDWSDANKFSLLDEEDQDKEKATAAAEEADDIQ